MRRRTDVGSEKILLITSSTRFFDSTASGPVALCFARTWAEGIGVYSYTYSIAGMAALFGMLGVNHHGNRSIAAVRDDREERSREFCNIWFWQIVLTAAAALGYSCYLLFVCSPGLRMISAIQILTVFNSAADINWLFLVWRNSD